MRSTELTLLAVRGFKAPGLTCSKHGMDDTGKTTGGRYPGDLPTEALAGQFIGMGEPAVGSVRGVTHDCANEGPPEPAIRTRWNGSVAYGSKP